jgi:hypothetical protein
MVMVDGRWW